MKRIFLLVAALTIVVGTAASSASANHSWNGYHWARTSNPFTVQLGDNVSGAWDSMLRTASSDWSASNVLDTNVVAGGTRPKPCKATLGRVEVCSGSYGNTGWLGVAQIWLTSGSHIVQGTVKNNDYYFGSSSYQYNNTAEMQHVICQEIGHTFGLDHQERDRSVAQHLHGLLPQHFGLRYQEHSPELARLPRTLNDLPALGLDHHRRRCGLFAAQRDGTYIEVRRTPLRRSAPDHLHHLGRLLGRKLGEGVLRPPQRHAAPLQVTSGRDTRESPRALAPVRSASG